MNIIAASQTRNIIQIPRNIFFVLSSLITPIIGIAMIPINQQNITRYHVHFIISTVFFHISFSLYGAYVRKLFGVFTEKYNKAALRLRLMTSMNFISVAFLKEFFTNIHSNIRMIIAKNV